MQLRRSAQLQQHSNSKLTPLYTKKLADLFVSLSISSNFTIKRRHFYFISHVNWILFVEFTPSNSCHGFFQKKLCFPPIKFENSSNRHLQDYGLLPNKTKSEDQVQEICFSTFIISSLIYRRTSDKDSPAKIFKKLRTFWTQSLRHLCVTWFLLEFTSGISSKIFSEFRTLWNHQLRHLQRIREAEISLQIHREIWIVTEQKSE